MTKRTRNRRPKRSSPDLPPRPSNGQPSPGDGAPLPAHPEARQGVVVTLYSGSCRVESDGRVFECVLPSRLARAQQSAVAAGDVVGFVPHGDAYRVAEVFPRRTVLSRPDPQQPRQERVIAANVDVVVQVSSVVRPPLNLALIDRYLIAIERGGAEPLICVNKIDLVDADGIAAALAELDVYRSMGLRVLACSARTGTGIGALRAALAGRTAVFVGASGVGKSSLLNALAPELELATSEVSRRHARGRHTTTRACLYRLDGDVRLIDTPGIRELGLWAITPDELRLYFPELAAAALHCRFNDCGHTHEPDCAVRAAVGEGRIPEARYATYVRILESLSEPGP